MEVLVGSSNWIHERELKEMEEKVIILVNGDFGETAENARLEIFARVPYSLTNALLARILELKSELLVSKHSQPGSHFRSLCSEIF